MTIDIFRGYLNEMSAIKEPLVLVYTSDFGLADMPVRTPRILLAFGCKKR